MRHICKHTWLKVPHVLFVLRDVLMERILSSLDINKLHIKREFADTGCPASNSRVFPACIQHYVGRLSPVTQ